MDDHRDGGVDVEKQYKPCSLNGALAVPAVTSVLAIGQAPPPAEPVA